MWWCFFFYLFFILTLLTALWVDLLHPLGLRRVQCHVCQVSISLCVCARVLTALHSQTRFLPRSRVKRSSWLRPTLLSELSGENSRLTVFSL